MVTIVSRTWTDADSDYAVDCNLLNGAQQDMRSAGGDVCGIWQNPNYGRAQPTTVLDPSILSGWGVRPYDWQFGVSVQQELLPRISAEVGYYRRWWPIWSGADVEDNILVSASDYAEFGVIAPNDSRLPGGGGYEIRGLYNINPDATGREENVQRSANSYGDYTRYWDGFDVTVQARLTNGLTVQGGTSTGRTVEDSCAVRTQVPEEGSTNPYCREVEPLRTQFKGLASYLIPRIDVQVSGTFSSRPGVSLSANRVYSQAEVRGSLGRDLASVNNVTINLLEPNTVFGDRVNQLDLRVGKILRFGRARANISMDVVNALNENANLGYSATFSPTWPTPTSVLTARIFRLTAAVDF
jgi:hypothetical protein